MSTEPTETNTHIYGKADEHVDSGKSLVHRAIELAKSYLTELLAEVSRKSIGLLAASLLVLAAVLCASAALVISLAPFVRPSFTCLGLAFVYWVAAYVTFGRAAKENSEEELPSKAALKDFLESNTKPPLLLALGAKAENHPVALVAGSFAVGLCVAARSIFNDPSPNNRRRKHGHHAEIRK